ncbi:DUF5658 family protein [Chloroflexota bacterium]
MAVARHNVTWRLYYSLWESDRKSRYSLALKTSFVCLHLVDLILTNVGASLGLTELNPLMRNLLAAPLQLLAIKLAMPLLIAWLLPGKLLIPAIAILAGVIIWNVKELLFILILIFS